MGVLLLLISRLYRIEKEAAPLSAADRHQLRQTHVRPILQKIYDYLQSIRIEVLPKSPAGRAVRYLLNQWKALDRYCDDGDLSIDNNATERSLRGIAIGRNNWTFLGINSRPINRLHELLPHHWSAAGA